MEAFLVWSGAIAWGLVFLFVVGLFCGSNKITFDPTIKNGKKEE